MAALRLGLVLGGLVLGVACTRAEPVGNAGGDEGLALASQVVERYRSATTINATLLVRIKPVDEDAATLSVSLWSTADGRIRVSAHKVGMSGVEALIAADGSFVAVTRDQAIIRDTLAAAFGAHLGGDASPGRLIEELKAGPLPYAASYERSATGLACRDPGSGLRAELDLEGTLVRSKTWRRSDGTVALRVEYGGDKAFNDLFRSSRWTLHLPGWDGECQARIQELRVLPQISDERMTLTVPDGPAMTWADFLARE